MAAISKSDQLYIELGKAAESAIDERFTVSSVSKVSLFPTDDEENSVHDLDESEGDSPSFEQKMKLFTEALNEQTIIITQP